MYVHTMHFEVDPPWSLEVKLLKTSLANGIRSDFHSCPSTRKGVAPLPIWACRWTLSQNSPKMPDNPEIWKAVAMQVRISITRWSLKCVSSFRYFVLFLN